MNKIIEDNIFGKLNYNNDWIRDIDCSFFKEQTIELSIRVNTKEEEIKASQKQAFQVFKQNQYIMVDSAKQAIFEYYCKNIEEYRTCFTQEKVDSAPYITKIEELSNLLNFYAINIDFEDAGISRLAFIFDATFEPELGIGVLFEGAKIIRVDVLDFII